MENPFRRRAAFELARVLYKAGARCQHGFIRAFCAPALPNNRREVVQTVPGRRRGLDAPVASQSCRDRSSAGHVGKEPSESLSASRPIKACTPSPKRAICFRLRVRDCLENEERGNNRGSLRAFDLSAPFDKLRQAHQPSSGTRLEASQAQRTWGREGP